MPQTIVPTLTLPAPPILSRLLKIPVPMLRTLGLLLLTILFATACARRDPRFNEDTVYLGGFHSARSNAPRYTADSISYWDGDGIPGAPSVRISLGEQRAFFYKNGELVGISAISSGREGLDTVTGSYRIIQKDRDHVSSRFGDYITRDGTIIKKEIDRDKDPMPKGAIYDGAKMPFFMRIVGGTGMHEGFLPGYPASHGCIRMPGRMAEIFFSNVSVGTPVSITN